MAKVVPCTIGESLYWSYANLAMMNSVLDAGVERPRKLDFIVRARLYAGLRRGSMHVRGFFDDEKLKLKLSPGCWYCGGTERLSADHIFPQHCEGSDGGENIVYACRRCNSSKGSKDLLVWMAGQGRFPPLYLLRRYLKMAIVYCAERKLLDVPLADAAQHAGELPFDLTRIPHKYPPASQLCMFVTTKQPDGQPEE